ncbi:nascent polypeptide-associated complex protein [Candidatus Pacearchaeota archaeon]|nr:MAG: nascent polypeptide-associated complex protein [Candidatus Pacearchaeota archaeon]
MLPGLGGVSPKRMQSMLKQLGIEQEEIEAKRVIIEKADGKIVIENPSVQRITMQGQESFQVVGEVREEKGVSEEDIKLVQEKTGVSEESARKALEKTGGDIAEAILELS